MNIRIIHTMSTPDAELYAIDFMQENGDNITLDRAFTEDELYDFIVELFAKKATIVNIPPKIRPSLQDIFDKKPISQLSFFEDNS